jgi:folate-binding protein YgfZ
MNLQASWQHALNARRHPDNPAEILHFGHPEEELRQAVAGTILTPLPQLACITASGADARDFLHGQLTNDVKSLPEGQAQLAAWCTAKGRVLANFILYPSDDVFYLILSAELLPAVLKRLQRYVLRSQVELSDLSAGLGHLGLSGPDAETALADIGLPAPELPMRVARQGDARVVRLPDHRFILSAAQESLPGLWQALSSRIQPAGSPVWRWLDIRAAFPWITGATTEAFVPQMMNFEKLGGVSFQKGCYPGQEIVARAQYLGEIKRHLYRLQSPVALSPGENIHAAASPDQAAGKIIVCAPEPEGQYTALAVALDACAHDLRQGAPNGPRLLADAVNCGEVRYLRESGILERLAESGMGKWIGGIF